MTNHVFVIPRFSESVVLALLFPHHGKLCYTGVVRNIFSLCGMKTAPYSQTRATLDSVKFAIAFDRPI